MFQLTYRTDKPNRRTVYLNFQLRRGFAELAERTANGADGVEFISSIAMCNPNLFIIRN